MKKTPWTTILIVLAIVVIIGIGIYLSIEDEKIETGENNLKKRFDATKSKISSINARIKNEAARLRLTNEMEAALSRKVDRLCVFVGSIVGCIAIVIAVTLYKNGFDLLTSVLTTAGLISLSLPFLSLILWRAIDFNTVVNQTRAWIKKWLYKRYGYSPDAGITVNESNSANVGGQEIAINPIVTN